MFFSNWRILAAALAVSLGGAFHFGFQMSVINPSEAVFRQFINDSYASHTGRWLDDDAMLYVWPIFANLLPIGALMGTPATRFLSERLGRKRSLYVTTGLALLACALQGLSKPAFSWEMLAAGRLLFGVSQGIVLGLQPLYFSEISPDDIRGLVGSVTGAIVELGFLLASVVALQIALGGPDLWPYLSVLEALPTLVSLIALPLLPESPKFLASRNDYNGARKSLLALGRRDSVDQTMKAIDAELSQAQDKQQISLRELFATSYIRKGVFLGWALTIGANFSGICALSFFSTNILENVGLSPEAAGYATIGVTAPCFVAAAIGGPILERFGRRPIVLVSLSVLALLNVLFIIFAYLQRVHDLLWAGYITVFLAAAISFVYGVGPGVLLWLVTSELVPQRARSTAQTLVMMMQWSAFLTAALVFYPLQQAVKEFCFFLHVVPLCLVIVYMWFVLPETKNKSTLEVMRDLGYKQVLDDDHSLYSKSKPGLESPEVAQKLTSLE